MVARRVAVPVDPHPLDRTVLGCAQPLPHAQRLLLGPHVRPRQRAGQPSVAHLGLDRHHGLRAQQRRPRLQVVHQRRRDEHDVVPGAAVVLEATQHVGAQLVRQQVPRIALTQVPQLAFLTTGEQLAQEPLLHPVAVTQVDPAPSADQAEASAGLGEPPPARSLGQERHERVAPRHGAVEVERRDAARLLCHGCPTQRVRATTRCWWRTPRAAPGCPPCSCGSSAPTS